MTAAEILAAIPRLSALVVGDICLDRWAHYDPAFTEPSRETGLARVAVVTTHVTPGAGGTVANNVAALGCGRVAVLGAVGDDGFGFELKKALRHRRIDPSFLVEAPDIQTFTYTKLINKNSGEEDLPRVDFIVTEPISENVENKLIERVRLAAPDFDVVLVSDQAETAAGGVVTPAMRDTLAQIARRFRKKVFWVDSRMRAELFRDMIVKPNEREAAEASTRLTGRVDMPALRQAIGAKPLIVTRGPLGAEIWDESGMTPVPGRNVAKPVDICGAGDSFSAGAALAYHATRSAPDAARFGNLVASITIMKRGTGTASPAEVLAAAQ